VGENPRNYFIGFVIISIIELISNTHGVYPIQMHQMDLKMDESAKQVN
jgi:hypothetical protein